jgi:RNA polymerase sigma-70 factor (ECF subfamily)
MNVDDEFTSWLEQSNSELIRSTSQALDIEAMLNTVKQRAQVRAIAATNGALALEPPREQSPPPESRSAADPSPSLSDGLDASVSAAVDGDPRAVGRVLESIRPLVVRYCRARVGRAESSFASADDVAQEVCLAVLTALPSYRDQGRSFLAFVYGIAAHKVADAHRAAARNRAEPMADVPDEPEPDIGPEQRAMQGELTRRLKQILDILPDKQREIVVLRTVVGLSAEETAEAIGSTPGAVRVAQHRALAQLRKTLSSDNSPPWRKGPHPVEATVQRVHPPAVNQP